MLKRTGLKLICILVTGAMMSSLLLTGCSGGQKPDNDSQSTAAEQKTIEGSKPAEEEQASTQEREELSGTVTISWPMAAQKPVWEDVAKAYMQKNPGVTVVLDDKDLTSYPDWLGNQLAGGDVTADIVMNNVAQTYFSQGKFVDFAVYLNKENPYMDGKKWKDGLNSQAYTSMGANDEIYMLNLDSVQVLWFYNKNIFKASGVEAPKDWDELVEICDTIKKAGYTPISFTGDAMSFYLHLGWLFWVYTDQYWKDQEPMVATQNGDYNFDPERDGVWKFDVNDPLNDGTENISFNNIRLLKLMKEGKIGPDSDKYREMFQNLLKIIPKYMPEGFFGTNIQTAQQLFVQGKAGMYMATMDFAANFDSLMKDAPEPFELGYFTSPPMKGDNTGIDYTRTVGGPVGFMGVVNKTKEQNDLTMDFMMFYASKEGQDIRYESMLKNACAPTGASLVKDVVMPEKWDKLFGGLEYKGAPTSNPYVLFSMGLGTDQESMRVFQDYAQRYFKGEVTIDELSKEMQKNAIDAIPRYLSIMGYRADALDDPAKDPKQ